MIKHMINASASSISLLISSLPPCILCKEKLNFALKKQENRQYHQFSNDYDLLVPFSVLAADDYCAELNLT